MLCNEDRLPRVRKERKLALRGLWWSVFSGRHMDNVPDETRESLETVAKDKRQQGRSSSPTAHSKAKQTDGEEQKASQGSGNKQENSRDKSEIPFLAFSRVSELQV